MHQKLLSTALIWLFLASVSGTAQEQIYRFVDAPAPKLIQDGRELINPFSGGMISPIFQQYLVNDDALLDLVVLDKADFSVRVFLAERQGENLVYRYTAGYEDLFPPLYGFIYMGDLGLGGPDYLVTNSLGRIYNEELQLEGYYVYEVSKNAAGFPTFKLISQALEYYDPGLDANYAISTLLMDQPTFADVDSDGDLDIISFPAVESFTDEGVMMYENTSSGGELSFRLSTECWGYFAEALTSADLALGVTCGEGEKRSSSAKHAGSNILAFDPDGDGDQDLLIADIGSSKVKLLVNGRSDFDLSEDSMIQLSTSFPEYDTPIEIDNFPSFSVIDVDQDGIMDLICTPGDVSALAKPNRIWYYRGTDAGEAGIRFELVKRNWLQDEAFDLGAYSIPAAIDIDGDEDLDLVVAVNSETEGQVTLSYELVVLENKGKEGGRFTFEVKERDFLGLKARGYEHLAPAFGDLDLDGDKDLLLGMANGRLTSYLNTTKDGGDLSFALGQQNFRGFDVGDQAIPRFVDIDAENNPELLVGDAFGFIHYFRAGPDTMLFLAYDSLGRVRVSQRILNLQFDRDGRIIDTFYTQATIGNAAPSVGDIDKDGKPDMLVGSFDGNLNLYKGIVWNPQKKYYNGAWDIIKNEWRNQMVRRDFGQSVVPLVEDLDGDGALELVLGTKVGGLYLLEQKQVFASLDDRKQTAQVTLKTYPNPTNGRLIIKGIPSGLHQYRIIDVNGKVREGRFLSNQELSLDISFLPDGLYLIEVIDPSSQRVGSLKVLKN